MSRRLSSISLRMDLLYDDGAVVYINGNEVYRTENLPAGVIDWTTLATNTVIDNAIVNDVVIDLPTAQLVDGVNLVAVEVHNRSVSSSDISFAMNFLFESLPTPNMPVFDSATISTDAVLLGITYTETIADQASDADGDLMFFSKVSGPDWLQVAADGTLSGTPVLENVGLNVFVVSVTDNDDGTTIAELQILVDEPPELARASLPGSDTALRFAVVPDTQGTISGVAVNEVVSVTAELLAQNPEFVIHVGDVSDGIYAGDAKFDELELFNVLMTNKLAAEGIPLYPIPGNHDALVHTPTTGGTSVWEAAFPHLFSGLNAIIDPTNVPDGSVGTPNPDNYSFVLDAGQETFFVALDMWEGGSNTNYSDWVDAQFAAIRLTNPDAHIFAYSHSGLFALAKHEAMAEYIDPPDLFIDSAIAHGIDGWLSGHNHIFDRSLVVDTTQNDEPVLFNITAGSLSSKFYGLSRSPADEQHVNRVIDSTTTAGEPIAYQLVEVNGPFVTIQTYMALDPLNDGTFGAWTVWDEYIYSTNGRQFTLAPGDGYTARNMTDTAPSLAGFVGTTVRIIDGTNTNQTMYTYDGTTSFEQYRNITTGWTVRDNWYDPDGLNLVSDIVGIHGVRETPGKNRTDTYTLIMSYPSALIPVAHQQAYQLVAFLDSDTGDSDPGDWLDAVDANLDTPAPSPVFRAPLNTDPAGTWGVDLVNHEVWARLDYQGDFAIVSNIIDVDGDSLADAWEQLNFGHLDFGKSDDLDGDNLDNLEEQYLGTAPDLKDTDGDLFDDGEEFASGLDPLRADSALKNSLLDQIRSDTNTQLAVGLYPVEALGGLSSDPALIDVTPGGSLNLSVQLWQSDDLNTWLELGDPVTRVLPIDEDKLFFKWLITAPAE